MSCADAPNISDECREEVYQYKIQRNTNINANVPLGARVGGTALVHVLLYDFPSVQACLTTLGPSITGIAALGPQPRPARWTRTSCAT